MQLDPPLERTGSNLCILFQQRNKIVTKCFQRAESTAAVMERLRAVGGVSRLSRRLQFTYKQKGNHNPPHKLNLSNLVATIL